MIVSASDSGAKPVAEPAITAAIRILCDQVHNDRIGGLCGDAAIARLRALTLKLAERALEPPAVPGTETQSQ